METEFIVKFGPMHAFEPVHPPQRGNMLKIV